MNWKLITIVVTICIEVTLCQNGDCLGVGVAAGIIIIPKTGPHKDNQFLAIENIKPKDWEYDGSSVIMLADGALLPNGLDQLVKIGRPSSERVLWTERTVLATLPDTSHDMALVGGEIFVLFSDRIDRYSMSGSKLGQAISGASFQDGGSARSIAYLSGNLYVSAEIPNSAKGKVFKYSGSGGSWTKQTVAQDVTPVGVAVDGNNVFVLTHTSQEVRIKKFADPSKPKTYTVYAGGMTGYAFSQNEIKRGSGLIYRDGMLLVASSDTIYRVTEGNSDGDWWVGGTLQNINTIPCVPDFVDPNTGTGAPPVTGGPPDTSTVTRWTGPSQGPPPWTGPPKTTGNPTTGGNTPTTGGNTPTTGGNTPTTGGNTPTTGGNTPTTGGNNPTTGGNTPTTGGNTPTTGGNTPTTGGNTPTTGGNTPTTGGTPGVTDSSNPDENSESGTLIFSALTAMMLMSIAHHFLGF